MTSEMAGRSIRSLRKILEAVESPRFSTTEALSRLASIIVGDFPEALFKLQALAEDGTVRVVSQFVTPLLPSIIDRYRSVLRGIDVRDATIPMDESSPITRSILSAHETCLRSPEEIAGYFSAHFSEPESRALGRTILSDLEIREVFLHPVRPGLEPFGAISVSSPRVLGESERDYWRFIATSVEAVYRRERQQNRARLHALAFESEKTPAVILDPEGHVVEVNDSLRRLLGWRDREATIRHLGDLRPCLPRRDALEVPLPESAERSTGTVYLPTHGGDDRKVAIEVLPLRRGGEFVGGAVVRFRPVSAPPTGSRLSRRQREVGRLLSEGLSPKEIAAALHLSVHTVNYHRSQLARKLAAKEQHRELSDLVGQLFLGNR